jgi:hypothetical protein
MYKNDKVIRRYSEPFKLKILDELRTGKLNKYHASNSADEKGLFEDIVVFRWYV